MVSKITDSGKLNYKGCRISIGSTFNIPLWQEKLRNYHDQHIVNLLQFGFPLGIKERHRLRRSKVTNHSSAAQFPKEVKEFIQTELQHGTLLGPFSNPPHSEYHCSPIMTQPKDVNKRRVIVDVS